jgi:hypothetical protein
MQGEALMPGRAVLFAVALLFITHCSAHAAATNQGTPALLPNHSPDTSQGSEGGFWKVEKNFDPVLRMKNVLLHQAVDVVPSLYFADGTEYRLSSVHLEPAGVATISIRSVLQMVPAALQAHASSYGMAGINYKWSWPAVITSIQNTDEIASLTDHSSANVNAPEVHGSADNATARTIQGTWWLPTSAADGFVALSNVALVPRHAHVQFTDRVGAVLATKQVALPKHATVVLRLTDLLGNIQGKDSAGGILIRYSGAANSVQVYAGIEDESSGYSAAPYLFEMKTDAAQAIHSMVLNAPGVMLGKPGPAMHFPADTYFSPFSLLHNVSGRPLSVALSLTASVPNASPATRTVDQITLLPDQTLQVDYSKYFSKDKPLLDGFGALSVAYQGREGDLLFQAGSMDQSQSYVFEVTTTVQAQSASKTICYWSLEGDTDSMIAIWNWSSAAEDLVLTLYYSGGQYRIPIHLDGRQAYNLDLMDLVRSQVPDAKGNVIPSTITSGSALLASTQGEMASISVATSAAVYNVRNATCSPVCGTCNGAISVSPQPTPVGLIPSSTMQLQPQIRMNTGGTEYLAGGAWSSSNTLISTVNSTGLAQGIAAGSSNTNLDFASIYTGAGYICEGGTFACPVGGFHGFAPTDVIQAKINSADITTDAISVSLSGARAGVIGTLTIRVVGASSSTTIFQGSVGNGTNAYSFKLGQLPAQDFASISAAWVLSDGTAPASYPYHIRVNGTTTLTQYNTPAESQCVGGAQADTIYDNSCKATNANLKSDFIFRVTNISGGTGSGQSISFGGVQKEAYCSGHSSTSLRSFQTIKGALGGLSNTTVATCKTGLDAAAGARIYIQGIGVKTVTDYCPACCGSAHYDNYSTSGQCSGLTSLPPAISVRIY